MSDATATTSTQSNSALTTLAAGGKTIIAGYTATLIGMFLTVLLATIAMPSLRFSQPTGYIVIPAVFAVMPGFAVAGYRAIGRHLEVDDLSDGETLAATALAIFVGNVATFKVFVPMFANSSSPGLTVILMFSLVLTVFPTATVYIAQDTE